MLIIIIYSCSNSGDGEVVVFNNARIAQETEPSFDKPYNAPASQPLIQIKQDDPLKIMVRADGAPGMYLGEDGEVHGFYVDLERMLMDEMGQAYEFVPYSNVGPVVQGMKDGSMHITLGTPDMPVYRSIAHFSDSYEVLEYVVFVQTHADDIDGRNTEELIQSLFGKTVGVQTQGHIFQLLREYKEITLREYATTTIALEALEEGKLDAVPEVKRNGLYYIDKEGWGIKSVGVSISSHKMCTGFSQMLDPELIKRYNEALSTIIADGRYEQLYISHFGILADSNRP